MNVDSKKNDEINEVKKIKKIKKGISKSIKM